MSVYLNQAADPVNTTVLELRILYQVTLMNTLVRPLFAVFHYHRIAGSVPADLAYLANQFSLQMGPGNLRPLLNARITVLGVDCRPLDNPLVPPVFDATNAGVGAIATDPLSTAMAVVLDLATPARGRSWRGSKHFCGGNEADTDGGDELNAAAITAWSTYAASGGNSLSDLGGNTFAPCVLSPTLSTIFGTPPIFSFSDGVTCTVKPVLGTMRKRKEKVGT